jgi:hypothetical protein
MRQKADVNEKMKALLGAGRPGQEGRNYWTKEGKTVMMVCVCARVRADQCREMHN